METKRICPSCKKTLPPGVPLGLCPECLIKSGFNTGTEPGTPGQASGFVPPPVEQIRKLFPQLEILELIGKGGMGAVYKARQSSLDRLVALKILPPGAAGDAGFAERFNREARALARLNHPHIVAVHDFGQVGGQPYLVMEFVDGPNLRQVEQAGRLTAAQALEIVPQICEALQSAHNEGVVHRDIKPENILLDKKGRVKITDFGIAKIVGVPSGKGSLTGAKDVLGTPHYMAPEQVEHPQAVDHRADIYSLGVVFYELLTGELPLGKFQPPSKKVQVDVRLDEVVLHTLEKEPERRYQHASEVKTDVETIATTPGQPSTAASLESGALLKTSACYISTPEYLHTFRGRFLNIYQGSGELGLNKAALNFRSGWSTVTIPLLSIRKLAQGDYPYSAKPVPIHYIAVTFVEGGQERTLLFTPVIRAVMLPDAANKFGAEWLVAIQEAFRARTGRTLSVELSDVAQDKFWVIKTLLATAVSITVALWIIPLIVHQRLPNRLGEWLPVPGLIAAVILMAVLLTARWWRNRSALNSGSLDASTFDTTHARASSAPAAGENRPGVSGWLRRSLIPEDTAARWARWLSFGAALVILVLGFLELPKFDLRPHELFFGVVLVLILTFVILAAGYLVGAVGSHRLRQGLTPRPDEPAASGEGTSQGLFTPAATANERSGLGKVAFGLFLAGILGSLLLAALMPRQGELVVILGVVELLLSLIFGLMSWHERFGRIAVIGNVVLAGLASLVFTVMVVTGPIKRAEMEKRVKAEIAAKREATERKAEEARLASPSFGPVIESILKTQEVQPEGRVAELLDLDTGRRGTHANFGDNDRETHAWLRTNQLDVLGVIEHGQIAVLCFDTVVMPAVNNDWETVTAQNLVTNWNLAQLEPKNITGLTPVTDNTDTWLFRTREGGRGVLQILGQSSDPLGVKIRYKLVQTADSGAASQPSPAPARRVIAQAPFVARLAEGEVELVALSHYPFVNELWWAADGGAAKEGPFVTEVGGDSSAEFRMFAVVVRLRKMPADASKPAWKVEPRNTWAEGKLLSPDKKADGKLVLIACWQPRSAATANVKVGIASGAWETVARARAEAVNPGVQPSPRGSAAFVPLADTEGGVRVSVTHNFSGMDLRLIAFEADGAPRDGSSLDQVLSETIGHTTMTFPGLSRKEAIRRGVEFHFQVRPYHWVEFHNVSLKPGERTQVEVQDATL